MLEVSFRPFPELVTARLRLRATGPGDAPALYRLRSDERVMRLLARPRATTIEDAFHLLAAIEDDRASNRNLTWALTLHGDDTLVGTIGLYRLKLEHHRAEVGYLLAPDRWGQGLMSEALEAVARHSFGALGFHSLEANTDPRNAASRRLLERNGFVLEGLFREDYFWDGQFLDSAIYSRLAPP